VHKKLLLFKHSQSLKISPHHMRLTPVLPTGEGSVWDFEKKDNRKISI